MPQETHAPGSSQPVLHSLVQLSLVQVRLLVLLLLSFLKYILQRFNRNFHHLLIQSGCCVQVGQLRHCINTDTDGDLLNDGIM